MAVMVLVVLEAGGRAILSVSPNIPVLAVVTGVRFFEILFFLLIIIYLGKGLVAVGLAGEQWKGGLMQGLLWSLVFAIVSLAGGILLMGAGGDPFQMLHVALPQTPGMQILFFFTGALIGPVAEELFFRGILYGFLRSWGVWSALTMTTLLFVWMHSLGNGVPVPQIVGSVVFTLAYEKKGQLLAPVTIHCLGNLALFFISLP